MSRLFFLVEGLFASSAINVNTVAELKALAQSKPDGLNYATLGEGSYPDLFLKWLNNQWGTKIVGIPYRGGGPAAQALAANDVQVTRFGVGNFVGVIEAGKVKALAVSSAKRSPVLPDVPTFAEIGWGDYPGQGWWGLAAPKGTPPADRRPAVQRVRKAVQRPEVRGLPREAGGGAGADHARRASRRSSSRIARTPKR